MKGLRLIVLGISLAVFLLSRYIPNSVLALTVGTYPGVILLLGAVLVAARYDLILSLAVLLAAGALFLENRKRVLVTLIPAKPPAVSSQPGAPIAVLSTNADDLVEGEAHPEHETPETESYKFEPTEDATNEFAPVGASIDMKQPLATASGSSNNGLAEHLTREGVV
jgi:hypothetical protein